MKKLLIRNMLSLLFAIILGCLGVKGNAEVLKTLFTVLGIVFSISMSLLVSFNLTKILNSGIRKQLRWEISYTRNNLLKDFVVSTLLLVVALTWNEENIRYVFYGWLKVDIELIALICIGFSLIYEIYNFNAIHKLHSDIEDAIIDEETKK